MNIDMKDLRGPIVLIVALTLLAALIAALVAQLKPASHPPHVATAQLLIARDLPVEDMRGIPDRAAEETTALTPLTYRAILLGDSLLARVVDVLRGEESVADLREAFSVETELESDTAYRRVYSPLITLRVRGESAERSRDVLDTWLKTFFAEYGNLPGDIRLISQPIVLNEPEPRHVGRAAAMAAFLTLLALLAVFAIEMNWRRVRP